ncbi:MAG: cbb3-type cytochrome c oxidase subunit I, partial [Candidatus Odinarchaeota archaeon]
MTATTVHVTEKPFYKSFKTLVGTTNHAEIGILYIVFAFVNFFLAGLMAMIIRIELALPGATIVDSETYSAIFTAHGTSMIFLVILPLGAGFGNYLIPKLIGAKDMYWPRWNNAAFWMLIPAAILIYTGDSTVGWTAYAPLSSNSFGNSVDFWILGFAVVGVSSLVSGINFIATIIALRKPGLGWSKLDLFSWSTLGASLIQLFATPIITTGLVMLLLDRILKTTFFSGVGSGGGAILWQHVFWSYSHPAVYIMILPSMGLTSLLFAKFSRNAIFGYKSMVISIMAITLLGFLVWAHHMYTTFGISGESFLNYFFNFLTFLIAI